MRVWYPDIKEKDGSDSKNALTVEDGRYFETLGAIRITVPLKKTGKGVAPSATTQQMLQITHKWVDTSIENFLQLAKLPLPPSHTPPTSAPPSSSPSALLATADGAALTKQIDAISRSLNLTDVVGCSNQTFTPSAGPFQVLRVFVFFCVCNRIIIV